MKILDAGTKQLTNAEVLNHVLETQKRGKERESTLKQKGEGPANLIKVLHGVCLTPNIAPNEATDLC
jgi:hypothetical protein